MDFSACRQHSFFLLALLALSRRKDGKDYFAAHASLVDSHDYEPYQSPWGEQAFP